MAIIGVNKSKGAIGQPGSANYVPPVVPLNPLQNQNTVIYVPSAGPAGKPGPQVLSGTGEPGNALTGSTLLGDYYMDGTTGNFWKRTTYTGNIGPTTLILAGNVQWEKVAGLKGPAGVNGQNQIPVLDLFISQTGSDTNSGLTNLLPLLTLTKAADIAAALKPERLNLHFLEATVTAANIRVDEGLLHFPYFQCDLSLMFPFEGAVTVGTYTVTGVTRPVRILCTKNVFIGGDEGENSAVMSITMPTIDTSGYDGTQLEAFNAHNGFIELVPDDFNPVTCTVYTAALTIKKNVFLFKSIPHYGNHKPCHFRFIPYNAVSYELAYNVESSAGIVENFTSVKSYWVPNTNNRLSTVPRMILHCDSNAILRGNMVSYMLRELRSEGDSYVEYGITHGYFFWPARQETPEFDDEALITDVTDYHIYETPDLDYTTHAPQLQIWGNEHSKIWVSAHRLVNNIAVTLFELTLKII